MPRKVRTRSIHWFLPIGLYVLAGVCWLLVVWLQIQMRDMALNSDTIGEPLPSIYWRYAQIRLVLGISAFVAVLSIFYLMAAKPS